MKSSYFVVKLELPQSDKREAFIFGLGARLTPCGLLGIHEGTVLSRPEDDPELDTDFAPQDRDWIQDQSEIQLELYFADRRSAEKAVKELGLGEIEERQSEDWDKEWRDHYRGVLQKPWFHILAPWQKESFDKDVVLRLRINPGAGFGTGTHETTQLCLQELAQNPHWVRHKKVLDFGSGSGVLALAAAQLGAETVHAVEIDPLALENARDNAELNGLADRVEYFEALPAKGHYDLILANILKPVLLRFSNDLASRLDSGALVLSGLLQKDVEEVRQTYARLLPQYSLERREKGEWHSLSFNSKV